MNKPITTLVCKMSITVVVITFLYGLQLSTQQTVKKNDADTTLKSGMSEFLFAEHCTPPNHVCPKPCGASEVEKICLTNGQELRTIRNRCEFERVRTCCPLYESGWKPINCELVHPKPISSQYPAQVQPSCSQPCRRGNALCATDGTSFFTFMGQCQFQKAKNCDSKYAGFMPFGEFHCKWIQGGPNICSDSCEDTTNQPICASNGFALANFHNKCELLKAIKCCPNYHDFIATEMGRCINSQVTEMKATRCIQMTYIEDFKNRP